MPNYAFRCQACQKEFLKSLPFQTKELPHCPICKGMTKRLITPPMVHFKGSGFYTTDTVTKSATPKTAPVATPPSSPPPPATPSSPSPSVAPS